MCHRRRRTALEHLTGVDSDSFERPHDITPAELGVEPRKTRTCVVVSNDIANRYGQAVTVVPTQSYTAERADRAYVVDLRAPRSTLREARVANGSMITTYDRQRVVSRAGKLAPETMRALETALTTHLGLDARLDHP